MFIGRLIPKHHVILLPCIARMLLFSKGYDTHVFKKVWAPPLMDQP